MKKKDDSIENDEMLEEEITEELAPSIDPTEEAAQSPAEEEASLDTAPSADVPAAVTEDAPALEQSQEAPSVEEEPSTLHTDGADADVLPATSSFVAPSENERVEAAIREERPLAEAEPVAEDTPQPSVAPAQADGREYGAPQMLYEDFIPYEYLHDTPSPEESAPVTEEAESDKKKKQKEKNKKPTREDELLAEVEAEMESRSAEPEPAAPASREAQAPAESTVALPIAAPTTNAQEPTMANNDQRETAQTRKYNAYEKKLRRRYKIDKDLLLSKNEIVPGFVLAKGENVIRSYQCLASKKGDGTICLTNKRLLINADERSEVEIDKVSGIKFSKNTYFSVAKFLFGLIFLGLGALLILIPFFRSGMNIPFITGENWKSWFFYLFIACGAVGVLIGLPLWLTMVKKYFYFNIFVKEGTSFLECKSKSFIKSEKKGKSFGFVVAGAGKESEKAARELGALLLEAKEGRYNF